MRWASGVLRAIRHRHLPDGGFQRASDLDPAQSRHLTPRGCAFGVMKGTAWSGPVPGIVRIDRRLVVEGPGLPRGSRLEADWSRTPP